MPRLRRVDCATPAISRRRRGRGFEYLDESGERIDDPDVLERIRALAIPPAWEDVWICRRSARATSRRPAWTPGAASSTATTTSGGSAGTGRSSTRWSTSPARCPSCEPRSSATCADAAISARAGARLRRPAPRPRLLPDRLGGLRRGERDLRAGDDAEAARDASTATTLVFDYEAKGGKRRVQIDRRSRGLASSCKTPARAARRRPRAARLPQRAGSWRDIRSADINDYIKEAIGRATSAPRTSAPGTRRCWPRWRSPCPRASAT